VTEAGPSPAQSAVRRRRAAIRIASAIGVALAVAMGVYLLLEAARPQSGLVSISFLLILPAALAAFVAFVGDPLAERGLTFYLLVPVALVGLAVAAAIVFFREGAVCVVMLSPLWGGIAFAGSMLTRRLRRPRSQPRYNDVFGSGLLLLPLLAIAVEPAIPLPAATATVTRSIVVDATPAEIWPLLRGIPDVRPGEGRWNLTQDIIGVPRPHGARLVGEGLGAERLADWGHRIRFREKITRWEPGHAIGWRFIFDEAGSWDFTDRHLRPDSAYFRVEDGGYRMTPLDPGRTRVTLETRYWMKTPINAYAALWGEVFVGDLETNLLWLVKGRAEGPVS
jgi:hypothetical protein